MSENGELKTIESGARYVEKYVTRQKLESITLSKIDSIVDTQTRAAVKQRLEECSGDLKKFQQSINENPVTLGGAHTRPIKNVRVFVNENLVPVRKNNASGKMSYAASGGNDHVALYEKDGEMHECVVSLWIAVKRKLSGLPRVVKDVDAAWAALTEIDDEVLVNELAATLPPIGSHFLTSMKMGDMYILGLSDEEFDDAMRSGNKKVLTSHLYRVQKLSSQYYCFRLHTWTSVEAKQESADMTMGAYLRIRSFKPYTRNTLVRS